MDYYFAPGGTGFDRDVAKYLSLRAQSVLLPSPPNDVASFITAVNTSASVQRPVGALGIGCHGHPYGILEIPLDSSSGKQSDINDVTRVEGSHALAIANAALFPRPIDPTTHAPINAVFRIVGCSVGAARPFLQHLKKALGDIPIIVATVHEDGEVALKMDNLTTGKSADGVLRMLTYDFRVNTPHVLEGQLDVIEAFDNMHFTFVDGKPIPRDFWKKRVPIEVFPTGKKSDRANITFNPSINGTTSLPLDLERWDYTWEPVGPWKVTLPAHPPQTTDERREFMRGQIKSRPEFAAGHPFPLHQSRGFATYDAFIDGYDWINAPKSDVMWAGYRSVYRIGAPITIPSSGTDMPYDWVDTTNTATHFGLDELNAALFVRII
jgi:hypothetical protein